MRWTATIRTQAAVIRYTEIIGKAANRTHKEGPGFAVALPWRIWRLCCCHRGSEARGNGWGHPRDNEAGGRAECGDELNPLRDHPKQRSLRPFLSTGGLGFHSFPRLSSKRTVSLLTVVARPRRSASEVASRIVHRGNPSGAGSDTIPRIAWRCDPSILREMVARGFPNKADCKPPLRYREPIPRTPLADIRRVSATSAGVFPLCKRCSTWARLKIFSELAASFKRAVIHSFSRLVSLTAGLQPLSSAGIKHEEPRGLVKKL